MYIPKRDAIHELREKKALSMNQLSIMAGLSPCSIYRIERGISTFTHPIRAKAIAEALNCKLSDIFMEVKNDDSNIRKN